MSFLLDCPSLGKRPTTEFAYGGEYIPRPKESSPFDKWVDYVFFKKNPKGKVLEWWYHRASEQWFLVCRDTHNNTDHISFSYEDRNKFSKLLAMNKKN